jgi:O-antigen/teichoic acid export membrane protein
MAIGTAFKWSGLAGIFGVALRFVSNLWLTRLLVPDAFALVFTASTVVGLLSVFTDLGFNRFAIRHPEYKLGKVHNTVWSFQLFRGCFVCVTALMIALAVYFFAALLPSEIIWRNASMPAVLALLGVNAVLQGATSSEMIVRIKAFDQRSVFLIETTTQITSFFIAISFAYWFQSVWALVAAACVSASIALLGSFILKQSFSHKLTFDRAVLRDGIKFGRWFWLSSVIGVLALQVDRVFLGAVLPPKTLGFFAIAAGLILAIEGVALKLVTSVVFPEFARVRAQGKEPLTKRFSELLLPTEILIMGLIGVLLGAGPLIVKLLYPPSYAQTGFLLQLLCLRLLVVRQSFSIQFYVSVNKEKYDFFLSCLRLVFGMAAFAIGYYFGGIDGALYASAGQGIAAYLVVLLLDRRLDAFRFLNVAIGLATLFASYIAFATLTDVIGRYI